ncbi:multisubstrate pseudouridine synthase 7, partial [Kickxella alabastrina]
SLAPVLEGIRQTGFVNYYGMQRFGTQSVASHTVGLAMLKSQWKQAVELVLCPRAGDAKDMAGARALWAGGQISEALAALPSRGALAERSILQDLVQQQQKAGVSNWAAGFACIPRNLRLMYVHAYQSYVWNTAASRRLQLYGVAGAVPGDLVVEAGDLAPDAGRVQPVVVTAETAHQYSVYDVVLPLPGWDVRYPENRVAAVYNGIMGKDGMSPERMAEHPMKEYRLAGAYRHVVIRPRDFSHQWMRYRDDKLPLARSDSDRIEGKHEPESIEFGELVALKLEFDLPSSAYATMLLRELMRQETAAGHQTALSNGTTENE